MQDKITAVEKEQAKINPVLKEIEKAIPLTHGWWESLDVKDQIAIEAHRRFYDQGE